MDVARIASLLSPFLKEELSPTQLAQVSTYLDLLLKWNARINLTAVRQPEEIIQRHFGESFFLADRLAPLQDTAIDLGSGAGFPGLPLKLYAPQLNLTLIEANHKKATFLREVVRTLILTNINIMNGRAETLLAGSAPRAHLVTLRAVERFSEVLPLSARFLAPGGRLALLVGTAQRDEASRLLPSFDWRPPTPIPLSNNRILLIGSSRKSPQ
jgi:16S rRNA (guanine527-N7)-methyltransferase